jgi:hypothetical protein
MQIVVSYIIYGLKKKPFFFILLFIAVSSFFYAAFLQQPCKYMDRSTLKKRNGTNKTRIVLNEPPTIRTVPVQKIRLGDIYRYKIYAFDPNGDHLNYRLVSSPDNVLISSDNAYGVITWLPNQIGQYNFVISVSDGESEVTQLFMVDVLPPHYSND